MIKPAVLWYNSCMKTKILSLVLLAAAAFAACGADLTYTIDARRRLQKNEGWGVSLCWWANMCGKWPDADIDRLVDWLVSPEGLNYNIFRYNIGGGDDPQNRHCTPHHMGKGKGLRAEMEGFQDGPGEPYNWTRDAAQRKILLKIKQKFTENFQFYCKKVIFPIPFYFAA